MYTLYALVSEVITRRFSARKTKHNISCKARNSLLFVNITKPQSLTTKTVAPYSTQVYIVCMLKTTHVTIVIALTVNIVIVKLSILSPSPNIYIHLSVPLMYLLAIHVVYI